MTNTELLPGSLFANRFEVRRAAGHGGMGTVYHAIDRYSGDPVALKLLHAGIGGQDEVERFAREAQLLSELRHPGIVAHIAHGKTPDGQRFLAMEWLDGHDLGQRLSRGPLPVRDCLRLTEQVADALSVAHQRGIIHRDLKPTNLFLVDGDIGRVKLLDFGIARRIDAAQAMTRTGMLLGTPEYMAPEQARGDRDLTPAADLFSLGCVLYECLTGKPPFVAAHVAAVLVRILFEDPTPVEQRRPGVPATLSAILSRLLAKEPAQRGADAAALRAELLSLGELPDPKQSATMGSPEPISTGFANQEQGLLGVVLAAPDVEGVGPDADQAGRGGQLGPTKRQALLRALARLGGRQELLVDGTLVVTVPPLGSAQDQAALAARAALLIKAHWPGAVVSMAMGRGALRDRSAVGEVVEQAARSQRAGSHPPRTKAATGIWIDTLSTKLLEGRFALTLRSGGALLLYEERDTDASRPLLGRPTPCVGRSAELSNLEAQLDSCIEESEARVALITGLPGAGKSRLRHEILRRVESRSERITVLIGRGDMISAGAPYGILGAAIRKLCGISGSEPLAVQRERLQLRVTEHVTAAARDRVALFVGELCNVSFPEEGNPILQAARQNPKLMRDSLRRALLDFLAAECSAAPVLLVLDDLQWGDELTVSVLDEAMREQATAPLFILALARPEVSDVFPRLWSSHRLQEIHLKGLSKKACERLIQQVLGKDVPADVVDRAVEQSGGNALFLEELIRLIAEGKSAEQPETVLAMLQARIGRLEPAVRGAVRAAAVFGQTFWLGGTAALLNLPKTSPQVESWLSALVDAELIEPHSSSRLVHEREYGFRHALVQAAAYSLITPSDLGSGHHLAGQFLEEAGEQDASTIAEHFERSGALERAAALYAQAAEQSYVRHDIRGILLYSDRSLACGATHETLGHIRSLQAVAYLRTDDLTRGFDAGMEALEHLPQGSPVWLRTVGELFWAAITLGRMAAIQQLFGLFSRVDPATSAPGPYILTASTLISVLGVAGQRLPAKALLERMLPLCDRLAAHEAASKAQLRMAESYYIYTSDVDAYRGLLCAHEAAEAFTLAGDLQNLLFAQQALGRSQARLGAFEDAEQTLRNNVELGHRLEAAVYVTWAEIDLAQVIAHDPARLTEAAAIADRIRSQDQRNAQPPFLAAMYRVIARSLAAQGQLDEAEAVAREAVRLLVRMPVHRTETLTILARVLLQNERRSEAQEVAEEALKIVESQGGLGYTDIVSRVTAAELRSINGDLVGARAALEGALTRISLSAEKILDAGMRQQFLTRVTENVRAQQLAQEWGLVGGPIGDFPLGAKHH